MKKHLSIFLISFALVTFLIENNAQASEKAPLKLCYTTWGQHGGKDLPGQGFVPDLISRVLTHAGYDVTIDIIPWPRCINLAKKQQYDMVASGWRGENFDPFFEYFSITLRNDINFIVEESSPIQSGELENFHGKIVTHIRDSGGMDKIRNNSQIQTRVVNRMDKMMNLLFGKRVDAMVTDPESMFLAAEARTPPVADKLRVLQPPVFTNFNSPLIPKGHPRMEEMRTAFEKSFKELIEDGIYDKLIAIHGPQFKFQVPLHARK
jgi:polar amino acid transport system substrate-binding protein